MKQNIIRRFALSLIAILLTFPALYAQEKVITEYLQMYAQGKMSEVRTALPDLLVEYPNDPGVKLLLAVVLEDAQKAVEIYKDIVQKFPESEWSDDAYWRLLQYYAVKGDVDKAEYELINFRKRYPTSEFLTASTDVVRTARSIANAKLKQVEANLKKEESEKPTKTEPKEKIVKEEPKPKVETENKSTNYSLQVGIYSTEEAAEVEKEKFLKKRLRTSIEEKTVNGVKKYAVVIGNYSSMESAEAAKKIIQQQCECEPIIYQK
jgi:hypothetical protein